MCYQQDITEPSLRLHFWQQLVLPVVSFGWTLPLLYASYIANKSTCNSCAGTWVRIILHAAHRLPLMQNWLQRTVQLWNKLAKLNPDTWLAHRAFVANICLWQSGDNDGWAARTIGHLSHWGVIGTSIPELWSVQLQPAEVEINMDALETAKWKCYMQPFYRDLPNIRGIGRTLDHYAQHFSCKHAGAKMQVYHNIHSGSGGLSCTTGHTKLRCITSRWQGFHDTTADCPGMLPWPLGRSRALCPTMPRLG